MGDASTQQNRQATLDALAAQLQALAKGPDAQQEADLADMDETLQELAQELGEMSQSERQTAAQALAQMAAQAAQSGDMDLAQALAALAQAAQSSDADSTQRATDAARTAAAAMAQAQADLTEQAALRRALAQVQNSRQMIAQAGQGQNQGQAQMDSLWLTQHTELFQKNQAVENRLLEDFCKREKLEKDDIKFLKGEIDQPVSSSDKFKSLIESLYRDGLRWRREKATDLAARLLPLLKSEVSSGNFSDDFDKACKEIAFPSFVDKKL